ncbi:hypothetical protein AUK45_02230 [Candidatus Peregrinibacteria bacterium CG2_30_44_17]|nr:MAG: hypothetical protein AUK45_02230 [Candidatus Peregrinibacteria bacterium CG2_30_44_17]
MIEDQISLVLTDLNKLKFQIKEIKKEIKTEGKIDSEDYEAVKTAYKDLKSQVKDMEEDWERQLMRDESYLKLLKMREEKDEEIAKANAKLFELIGKLPPKPFEMDMESEDGNILIQIAPEMRIYLNGKEEKKRT